ncbi:hypothetical protein CEXT_636181 [Caerostris extrusa]|uniref:Uncharacterized protein n=1 Tax=Caerostris extrusa TaxID=172846 RepID=A0AAV4TAR5_CAEEX|nr:hypothetical protein CEXT_636181 [Caerostris extrusa]
MYRSLLEAFFRAAAFLFIYIFGKIQQLPYCLSLDSGFNLNAVWDGFFVHPVLKHIQNGEQKRPTPKRAPIKEPYIGWEIDTTSSRKAGVLEDCGFELDCVIAGRDPISLKRDFSGSTVSGEESEARHL